MSITQSYLEQFHQYALGKVSTGEAKSLTALAAEWEAAQREYDETVAELRECVADMEAGIGRPLREVDAEIRAKYGFAPAQVAMKLPAYVHPRVTKALDENVAWWSKHRSPEEAERWYDGIVAALEQLRSSGLFASSLLDPLIAEGRQVQRLVEERIAELRSRVWWQ